MRHKIAVAASESGLRLDVLVARHLPQISRSRASRMVEAGLVVVDGRQTKSHHLVRTGEIVEVHLSEKPAETGLIPEPMPLDIVYEDEHLTVVNKPAGLVVHPGAGRRSGTLVNALLAHGPLSSVGAPLRPGIVHRLDKDTSGLMLAAKTDRAHLELSRQIQKREIHRTYMALVWGRPQPDEFILSSSLGRHPRDRKRIAVTVTGKGAVTRVAVRERFEHMSLVRASLLTGRTHQIRVHLSAAGWPVVGDRTYGSGIGRERAKSLEPPLKALVASLPGQALHACELSFLHPVGGERVTLRADPPPDMTALLTYLRSTAAGPASRRTELNAEM